MKTFSIFFGIIVALAGVNIILRAIFHISVPFFRIMVGVFFVYIGFSFLIHRPVFFSPKGYNEYDGRSKYNITFSSDAKFNMETLDTSKSSDKFEINSIFSISTIDISSIENQDNIKTIEINTLFGQSLIYVAESAKLNFFASAVFGESILPNNERVAFGDIIRKNNESSGVIDMKVNSIFGQSKIVYKK